MLGTGVLGVGKREVVAGRPRFTKSQILENRQIQRDERWFGWLFSDFSQSLAGRYLGN